MTMGRKTRMRSGDEMRDELIFTSATLPVLPLSLSAISNPPKAEAAYFGVHEIFTRLLSPGWHRVTCMGSGKKAQSLDVRQLAVV